MSVITRGVFRGRPPRKPLGVFKPHLFRVETRSERQGARDAAVEESRLKRLCGMEASKTLFRIAVLSSSKEDRAR
jgi:hypothetical protein